MKKDEKNSSPAKLSISDSFTAKVIDRFLDYLKKASWSGRILKSEALCGSVGLYGIYFIGVMGFVFVLCLPLKIPGFGFVPALLAGICVLLAAVFLNFAAYKMLPSLKLLIDGTPVRISSPAFFTVSAVFPVLSVCWSWHRQRLLPYREEVLAVSCMGYLSSSAPNM